MLRVCTCIRRLSLQAVQSKVASRIEPLMVYIDIPSQTNDTGAMNQATSMVAWLP